LWWPSQPAGVVLAEPSSEAVRLPVGPQAIEDHALIGDTRTAALVDSRGQVAWLCAPSFESAPILGSLVGGPEGGRFAISPIDEVIRTSRRYREGSTVMETTWETRTGAVRLTEGMVAGVAGELVPGLLLVRRIEGLGGEVDVGVLFDPKVDLGRPPRRVRRRAGSLLMDWGSLALTIRTDPDLEIRPGTPERSS
jgi:GH15 family glucan-1,4-alpha-glucosidase